MFRCLYYIAFALFCVLQAGAARGPLEEDFRHPPPDSRPLCYWGWIAGHITKEGIRADLEAMKAAGMKGALICDLSLYMPQGPVMYGTPEWRDCLDHALRTAGKLGLEIILNNCPGWATSGGPWVPVEDSMKELTFSELEIDGPGPSRVELPRPGNKNEYYQDVAVLAVPCLSGNGGTHPTTSSNLKRGDLSRLADIGDSTTRIRIAEAVAQPEFVFSYPREVTLRSLRIGTAGVASGNYAGEIAVSSDGMNFQTVRKFNCNGSFAGLARMDVPFPAAKGRVFRVVLEAKPGTPVRELILTNMRFSKDASIENAASKSMTKSFISRAYLPEKMQEDDRDGAVPVARIIDLSDRLRPDGTLEWSAPAGKWNILRMGYTTTGATNHPTQPAGHGLEVDKMDREAVTAHFHHSLDEIITRAKTYPDGALKTIHIDSWEAGMQNWTRRLPEEFERRRGYDMTLFLPVLAGRMVESRWNSEAFLYDFRRTICELIAENYFEVMKRLANGHGLRLSVEPYAGFAFDEYLSGARADMIVAEFWVNRPLTIAKRMSSLVETTGGLGSGVAAEAFTATPADGRWQATPGSLKPTADLAFVQGVNRCIFHAWALQPRGDLAPGFTWGRYGTEFGRLNTWWPLAGAFVEYLSRSGYLLRQGRVVADVLFLKNSGPFLDENFPAVSRGHDFNYIAPSQLMKARARDGKVVLATGGVYRVIALPAAWMADLPLLKKLSELRASGVPVVGPPPLMPAGRGDLANAMEEWKQFCDEQRRAPQAGGLPSVLARLGLAPDFRCEPATAPIDYIHRASGSEDIYFVRNSSDQPVRCAGVFRVSGRLPEAWDPVTGKRHTVSKYNIKDGVTRIEMELPPHGSMFVLFQAGTNKAPPAPAPGGAPAARPPLVFEEAWYVSFRPPAGQTFTRRFESLQPWNESDDLEVRYFSGIATYRKTIPVPRSALKPDTRAYLDLGRVCDLAGVEVNGKSAGIVWTPPLRVEVTRLLRAGDNEFVVKVANRWINRLVGDESLPIDVKYKMDGSLFTRGVIAEFPAWYFDREQSTTRERRSFTTWRHYRPGDQLVPSGLIGPVRLEFEEIHDP
jgi:hypothetical protein